MKYKNSLLIFFLILCFNAFSQKWAKHQIELANTANNVSYLTINEKEAIMFINLCRLFPGQFAQNEIANYNYNLEFDDSVLKEFEKYKKSLLNDLMVRKSCKALKFDNSLYEDAKCYSTEISTAERYGHDRMNCKNSDFAECISFGEETGKEIALQWLFDFGVKSFGHRNICLDKTLKIIGLKINVHYEWQFCAVAELY